MTYEETLKMVKQDTKKRKERMGRMICKDCIHSDVCEALEEGNGIPKVHPKLCGCFKDKSRFIELPCKIGTKIYDISELLMPQCYSPDMYIFDADDICISKDNRGFIFTIDGNDYRYEDFGKSAFFSKEEAEKALKRQKKG